MYYGCKASAGIEFWWLVPRITTSRVQSVPNLFTLFSWLVLNLFMTCSFLVHVLFTTFSQFFTTCSGLVHSCNTSSWHVYKCSKLDHNLFMTWSQLVHDLFITCSQLAHDFFTTFSQIFVTWSGHVWYLFTTFCQAQPQPQLQLSTFTKFKVFQK